MKYARETDIVKKRGLFSSLFGASRAWGWISSALMRTLVYLTHHIMMEGGNNLFLRKQELGGATLRLSNNSLTRGVYQGVVQNYLA